MSLNELIERFRRRDRAALSRLLTVATTGDPCDRIRTALDIGRKPTSSPRSTQDSPITIAVTGSGGVGKSTLIGKLIEAARNKSLTVAVLACDPQSSRTGGALLGDRIRMSSRPDDLGVFIRSVATPGGHSGIAPNIDLMAQLLGSFGFDLVLLETVGAGQGDTAVRDFADVVVVLVQPETGDELQWEKAGQLEIADVVVVHKADLPGAERVEAQIRDSLQPDANGRPVILRASASKQLGIEQLWTAINDAAREP